MRYLYLLFLYDVEFLNKSIFIMKVINIYRKLIIRYCYKICRGIIK